MVAHRHHRVALRELAVDRITDVTPWLRRVTLVGQQLGSFDAAGFAMDPFVTDAPDDHVKVFFAPGPGEPVELPGQGDGALIWHDGASPIARDYTVRRFDPAAGELDLEFVLHGAGPGSTWAGGVEPGARVHVAGPRASHVVPRDGELWLLGDRTAVPAIARWVEELEPGAVATVVIESADGSVPPLRCADGARMTVRTVADGAALARVVGELPAPDAVSFVFVAAEFTVIRSVRAQLATLGISGERVHAVSYWRGGEVDPDAGDLAAGLRLIEQSELLTPNAIRVAATLGLADLIADGVTGAAQLAERTGTDPSMLGSLCAHLVRAEVLTTSDDGLLGLGATGKLLLDAHPFAARRRLRLDGAEGHFDAAWSGLLEATRSGRPGFDVVYGRPFWDEIRRDPEFARSFDEYLDEWCAQWAPAVAAALDWSEFDRVLDLGGGSGRLLAELLGAAPESSGTLVELPEAAAAATDRFARAGLADRTNATVGDFFGPLPEADVAVLAQVIHDWPDVDAVRILRRAAAAVGPAGHVVVVERLHTDAVGVGASRMTLLMQNLFSATERTIAQYAGLGEAAGLRLERTVELPHELVLLDLVPVVGG